jgi:hypothetical protein
MKTKIAFLFLIVLNISSGLQLQSISIARSADIEIVVNGFPLSSQKAGEVTVTKTDDISRFCKAGVNEARLRITNRRDDGKLLEGFGSFRIEKRVNDGSEIVFAFEREVGPDSEEPNFTREFISFAASDGYNLETRAELTGLQGTEVTIDNRVPHFHTRRLADSDGCVIHINFEMPDALLPALPWQAPKPVFEAADEAAIRKLAVDLNDEYIERDIPGIIGFFNEKLARAAEAVGAEAESIAGPLGTYYAEKLFVLPGLAFVPLTENELKIEAVGEDLNLFAVSRLDGRSPVIGTAGETSFDLPIFVSKVDDQWVIVE